MPRPSADMTPLAALSADWPTLDRLLDEALALAAPQRAVWLERLDGEAAPLRETLRRLLALHHEAETEDFLATLPALDLRPEVGVDHEPGPGDRVGPWRLVGLLGEGGMGSVWRAERADGAYRREVALKLPRIGWGRGLAERLARERDILASLEHRHIARLYDAGVDALGRPWLALEIVQGEPIDAWCAARGSGLHERLALLAQACDAVAYAHSRLVIHRDLKPANILVTADGEVRLLDFGIARLLDPGGDGADTEVGQRALTPDYASPEQVLARPLGTASDVYGLGVVGFELCTGQRPHRRPRSAAELARAVAEEELPLASRVAADPQRAKALRGDLDAVLATALAREPARRYASAGALAEDLRRWRVGEAVSARVPPRAERLRRLLRRHRTPVAAAALAATALLVGSAVALVQARRAQELARAATAASAEARQAAERATAVQDFLVGIFNASSARQDDPQKARQVSARELLDLGAQRLDEALADQPAARQQLAGTLSALYAELDLDERSLPLAERAEQEAARLYGSGSEPHLQALARLLGRSHESGKVAPAAARALSERALAVAEAASTPSAGRSALWQSLAMVREASDLRDAEALARRALAEAQAAHDEDQIAAAMGVLGTVLYRQQRPAEAEPLLAESIRRARREATAWDLGVRRAYLAEVQAQRLRYGAAVQTLQTALDEARRRYGEDHLDTQQLRLRLGSLTAATGRFEAALPLLEEARRRWAAQGEARRLQTSLVLFELSTVLREQGRLAEAERRLNEALTLRQLLRPDSVAAENVRQDLALTLAMQGRGDAARRLLDEVDSRLGDGRAAPALAERQRLMRARIEGLQGHAAAARTLLAPLRDTGLERPPARGLELQAAFQLTALDLAQDDGATAARRLGGLAAALTGAGLWETAPGLAARWHLLCARLAHAGGPVLAADAADHENQAQRLLAGNQSAESTLSRELKAVRALPVGPAAGPAPACARR
ncbi:serine/threonine-protein kinase [Rubrivivax gelatinosus]|uniref:serine/threonine-protein kinase n=3 Tax=Rubrivivax gelatinosus TaxID=28068 RepID=UPI0018CAD28F|nr:serine/threonine-protein kinase [Rubrivivax gelatinosus]MBG6078810.1 serine/threonine-protein kinase [Rubrivivax gelatinosus]